MQHPTLTNVRIRSTRDALQIFYAVARNILPMTTRRLDAEERRAISSGCVYIWEERCANSEATGMGMERWTDGMGWGPSRVRDEFLFYHQRENEVHEDPNNPSARWASMMRRRDTRGNLPFSRSEAERLIKQTYSVHVSLPEDRPRGITRKWHLTAYFSQTTLDGLGTIDSIPSVGDVIVPEGMFKSARASKLNKRSDPMPVEDIGAATHEPWSMNTPPSSAALPAYGTPPPKWATGSPQPVHIPRQASASDPYTAAQAAYPTPRSSYESVDYSARPPLSSHTAYAGAPLPLPTLHDTGISGYRDPSPYTHSSCSSSSEPGTSPRTFSSPLTPPTHAPLPLKTERGERAERAGGPRLVPLSYLQGLQQQRSRDPLDELTLKRFSTPDAKDAAVQRHSWAAPHPPPLTPHAPPYERFEEDETKPTLLRGGGPRW